MNLRQAMSRFQNTIYARAVRHGLTLAIPFLIMGSFALLLTNFPLGVYQDFIRTWMNGAASAILETLYLLRPSDGNGSAFFVPYCRGLLLPGFLRRD